MKPLRERCGRLRDYWYVAAQSKQVDSKTPIRRIILEEKLVLWRDNQGKAVAQRDRCLHRNAPLSEGDLFDGKIGCPYHGWTYDANGRCVHVPSANQAPSTELRLVTFPVIEADGLIWVWMGHTKPQRQPFEMPYWNANGWTTYYMETMFDNGVTALVENFMDVPHTIFVHRGWFRNAARRSVDMEVVRHPDSVFVTYEQPNDSIGFTGKILNPDNAPMTHTDRFWLPNHTRVDYHFGDRTGFVITSTCTPETEQRTRVFTLISLKTGHRWLNRVGKLLLPWYTRKVIQQDVAIMKIHGDNVRSFGNEMQFHHTDADLHHRYIEQLREWAAQEEGEPIGFEQQTVRFWI